MTIAAARCQLRIEAQSVQGATLFTIAAYDTTVLDFELTPHGRRFGRPVEFSVCYRGTRADPSSPHFDGTVPEVLWFNDHSGNWQPVPSVVDSASLTISARLSHFSRYAVANKASW